MDLENIVNRYDRQERIEGWDQERLDSARIAVIGTDILANFTTITLSSLGFGKIEIYGQGKVDPELGNYRRDSAVPDYSGGFLYFESQPGDTKAETISGFIKRLNPLVETYGINIDLCRQGNMNILGNPDLLIDTTNDPASKITAIEYASAHNIPMVSMSSSDADAKVGFFDPERFDEQMIRNIVFAEYNGKKQGTSTSQAISALGVDEARKHLMPIGNETPLEDIVIYNLQSKKRFDNTEDMHVGAADFHGKRMVMIGAGALGNFLGLDMVLNNIGELYIVDDDDIESTNLNRQIWFYDAVGEYKAAALVNKLKRINPRVSFRYAIARIEPEAESFFTETDMDLLCDTVDNNKTRALLNHFSQKHMIPFISGGTSYNAGQAIVSYPGKTACLNCQADIDQLAKNAYTPGESCIYAPQASVITSNQIIAGFMSGEARTVFDPGSFGEPINNTLKYMSQEKFRVGVLPAPEPCSCFQDHEKLANWMEEMRYLYKDGRT